MRTVIALITLLGSSPPAAGRRLGRGEGLVRPDTQYSTQFEQAEDIQETDAANDIILQTRSLANYVKSTLTSLASHPDSALIVNKIIRDKDNVCLTSLEEGLAGIETATQLVESAEYDIKTLIQKINKFGELKDPSRVVHEVANILRILEPLVKNLSPSNPEICPATPDQARGSLRSVAVLVDTLASTRLMELPEEGRAQLKLSGAVIYSVTTLVSLIKETFSGFNEICTADKQYNLDAIIAIGDLTNHLADLFGAHGGIETSEALRKGKLYTERVVVSSRDKSHSSLKFLDRPS